MKRASNRGEDPCLQVESFACNTIVERAWRKPFWLRLGNAVQHKDSKGFTMNLQAVAWCPVSSSCVSTDDESGHTPQMDTQQHEREPEFAET